MTIYEVVGLLYILALGIIGSAWVIGYVSEKLIEADEAKNNWSEP